MISGVKGVATAMIIQGIVMTVSVVLLFIFGIKSTGLSYSATVGEVLSKYPEWFSPVGALTPGDEKFLPTLLKAMSTVFSFAVLWGLTTFTMPHVSMSALTYKDTKTLHDSIKIGTIVFATWMLGLNGLCFAVKYHFGGMLGGPGQPTPDLAIPMLAVKSMPAWAAGLVLAGVCSAVQSSVGGMILSLSGTIIKDLFPLQKVFVFNPDNKEKHIKTFNTICTLLVAFVMFIFACNPPEMLASLVAYSTGGMTVAFFACVLFGLYWKRANEYGACAGMISGIVLYIGIDVLRKFLVSKALFPADIHPMVSVVIATVLSTIIMVIVSIATPKSPYRVIQTWFGKEE